MYGSFDYWVKENIFERRLGIRGNSCCFINWHCVDLRAVSSLIRSGLFSSVPDWWRVYKCPRFVFMPPPIVLAYYSNLVTICRAQELDFRVAVIELIVFALVSSFHSTIVRGPVGFSSYYTGVQDIAVAVVFYPSPENVFKFVQSLELLCAFQSALSNL